MSIGKQKFVNLMNNVKKLSPARQKVWIAKINAIKATAKKTKELGVEPAPKAKVIQLPATTIVGKAPVAKTWLQETSDWFGKLYDDANAASKRAQVAAGTYVMNTFDNATLAYANELDKVYTAVATEVAKVPATAGKAIGDLTGTGDYWPYLLGAGVALIGVYYFTQISPIRRFA